VQSSRHDGSAANIFRGIGSVSDFSSRGIPESVVSFGREASVGISGISRARNRLTSASPLAGRGFPYDIDSLSIPGYHDDLDKLEGFDLGHYLDSDTMENSNSNPDAAGPSYTSQQELQNSLTESAMDQEGINFLDFLAAKISSVKSAENTVESTSIDPEILVRCLYIPFEPPKMWLKCKGRILTCFLRVFNVNFRMFPDFYITLLESKDICSVFLDSIASHLI